MMDVVFRAGSPSTLGPHFTSRSCASALQAEGATLCAFHQPISREDVVRAASPRCQVGKWAQVAWRYAAVHRE